MKTITVTKQACLKAVAKEPLKPGNWIYAKTKGKRVLVNKTCSVCAVGAVLRAARVPNSKIIDVACCNTSGHLCLNENAIKPALEVGNYLAALSSYFEGSADFFVDGGLVAWHDTRTGARKPMRTQRKLLAAFIEANFPDSFTVDVP